MSIPTLTPVNEAAQAVGITPARILKLADTDQIQAVRTPDGDILVSMADVKEQTKVRRSNFEHLNGQGIHIAEASRKYDINSGTISNWRRKGLIRTVGREKNRILINEADIAYIKAAIEHKGLRQGQDLQTIL
jgi:predicted site-specific integrase-resolvase